MSKAQALIKAASNELETRFSRIREPSQYIDAFRTAKGLEIAVQRNREALNIWTEPLSGLTSEVGFSPVRVYATDDSRDHNLNLGRAPRLRKGRPAWYWRLESIEQLRKLLSVYVRLGPASIRKDA